MGYVWEAVCGLAQFNSRVCEGQGEGKALIADGTAANFSPADGGKPLKAFDQDNLKA